MKNFALAWLILFLSLAPTHAFAYSKPDRSECRSIIKDDDDTTTTPAKAYRIGYCMSFLRYRAKHDFDCDDVRHIVLISSFTASPKQAYEMGYCDA